ncbi:hypothetical protein I7I50_03552 [Histoplasma capsulatum G186AR]|uniref:Uncharacterized protein n=1 Tax=Ajellomyces capsulatus TaxID=5037 RepID=A0A8H8CYD1_AJECA|nr:hypothetical protein I7I52_04459 [Histoplasma capsulatum]QSS74673.1 hypothetical protein I7I50_03552 [Histoplasma capsulatum G186AR]
MCSTSRLHTYRLGASIHPSIHPSRHMCCPRGTIWLIAIYVLHPAPCTAQQWHGASENCNLEQKGGKSSPVSRSSVLL